MTIWVARIRNDSFEFGSKQAAGQFIDNYPPHRGITLDEMTIKEARTAVQDYSNYLATVSPNSTHAEWLKSRIEFYSNELKQLEAKQEALLTKIENLHQQ